MFRLRVDSGYGCVIKESNPNLEGHTRVESESVGWVMKESNSSESDWVIRSKGKAFSEWSGFVLGKTTVHFARLGLGIVKSSLVFSLLRIGHSLEYWLQVRSTKAT